MNPSDRQNFDSKGPTIGCLVVVLAFAGLPALFIGKFIKANLDADRAQDEFKRVVKPEELRAWVFSQLRERPQERSSGHVIHDWPAQFPHFRAEMYYTSFSSTKDTESDDTVGAVIAWSFFDQDLIVRVILNSDGTPTIFEDEQQWAPGITIRRGSK